MALTSKELIARLPADVQPMVQAKKTEILQQLEAQKLKKAAISANSLRKRA